MLCFFNLAGAVYDPDNDGVEVASLADARIMAARDLGDFIRDRPETVWTGEEVRLEVTDSNRLVLCTVIAFAVYTPAAGNALKSWTTG